MPDVTGCIQLWTAYFPWLDPVLTKLTKMHRKEFGSGWLPAGMHSCSWNTTTVSWHYVLLTVARCALMQQL